MNADTAVKLGSSRTTISASSPGTGVLIDLTDEENVPFPQQLMNTAEMDDTYGIFELKQRSASVPVSALGPVSSDVFSPIPVSYGCDSVFKIPGALSQGTPVKKDKSLNGRKSDRLRATKVVGSDQVLAASASMLGLNDGFIFAGSSSNSGLLGEQSTLISDISSVSVDRNNSSVPMKADSEDSFISPISTENKSPKGIMDASNDSQLLDIQNLSSFTISDSETSSSEAKKAKLGSESDIILDAVWKRQSLKKKPANEAIAKKVQEMFDAASPSKNPHLFTNSKPAFTYRTYTPTRTIIPRESFSYGTPRRQALFTTTEAEKSSYVASTPTPIRPPNVLVSGQSPPVPVMVETPTEQSPYSIDTLDKTPASNPPMPKSSSSVRCNLNLSRLHSPMTTGRLSFSSTSSSSGCETSSLVKIKSAAVLSNPICQPKIQSKPMSISYGGRQRLSEPKQAQPLKAIHHIVPPTIRDPKSVSKLAGYGCVSAPVYRKFAPPIAASSPKVDTSFSSCTVAESPTFKRTSIARSSGYGQQIPSKSLASPRTRELSTSQSRIRLPSPNTFQRNGEIKSMPSPILKPVTAGNVTDDQRPSGSNINVKQRSASSGSVQSCIGRTGKMSSSPGAPRAAAAGSSKNTKENSLRIPQKLGLRK